MKRKLMLGFGLLVLVLSLYVNYAFFQMRHNNNIYSASQTFFQASEGVSTVFIEGCRLSDSVERRSDVNAYFWKVEARAGGGQDRCTVTELSSHKGLVSLTKSGKTCELVNIDADAKTATIRLSGYVVTANGKNVTWSSTNPEYKDSGQLIKCQDHQLNWYPL